MFCNSSPSFFFNKPLWPNTKRFKIVLREFLSSSSNLTSSKVASNAKFSSTFGMLETRRAVSWREDTEEKVVLIFESKLRRGVLPNGDEEARVGDVPPISNDLRYPWKSGPKNINQISPQTTIEILWKGCHYSPLVVANDFAFGENSMFSSHFLGRYLEVTAITHVSTNHPQQHEITGKRKYRKKSSWAIDNCIVN